MDVIETWSKPRVIRFTFKDTEEFKIGFGVFDRNDVSIKSLECPKNVVKVRLKSDKQ